MTRVPRFALRLARYGDGAPKDALMDALGGKRVSLGRDVDTYKRTLSGECSPADLALELQARRRRRLSPCAVSLVCFPRASVAPSSGWLAVARAVRTPSPRRPIGSTLGASDNNGTAARRRLRAPIHRAALLVCS